MVNVLKINGVDNGSDGGCSPCALLAELWGEFDAWRLGHERPRHKVIVNVILAMVLGFGLGGMAQYQWDKLGPLFCLGGSIMACIMNSAR